MFQFKLKSEALSLAVLLSLGLLAGQTPATALAADAPAAAKVSTAPVLKPHSRVELPGYTGDFDHFAFDVKGDRLFLAAEDHGTLEVFSLSSGKLLKTIAGFEAPHGIHYAAAKNRLIVTDSGAGLSKILDATTYKILDTVKLKPGADSMTYDAAGKNLFVVSGGKNGNIADSYLSKIDAATGKVLGEIKFETNKVEAMAAEQKGNKLYVNVTGKNILAAVDKKSMSVAKEYPISEGEANAAMAFDEAGQRLFIVTRKPFKLLVVNALTGKTVATFDAPNRTNEAIFDKLNRRVYLAGDNFISVIQQVDADHYEALAQVPTAVGAKTTILVPELGRVYVALSPGEGKTGAAVLRYDVTPSAK